MMVKQNFSLVKLNTFGIDVKAKVYAEFSSEPELRSLLQDPEISKLPKLILGGGSNILFTKDFEGAVLKNTITGINVVKDSENEVLVEAGGGEIWHDFVLYCINKNLGGCENLSLIPGTVGASPIQNIGAYGVEIKDVLHSVKALEVESLNIKSFSLRECEFGYRDSVFKKKLKDKYIIVSVTFRLLKNPQLNLSYGAIKDTLAIQGITNPTIKDVSDAVCAIRRSKLPDPAVIGNAGSFFKNPEISEGSFLKLKEKYPGIPSYPASPGLIKIPAGWLIEKAGWKGKQVGQAGVHKNQALVLVNLGNVQGREVKNLSEDIKRSVADLFDVQLETEVNIL